jgi:hypothetical protein
MHFYLIRSDLTRLQHVHPNKSPDGTWTAPTAAVPAGDYRTYVQFVPHADAAGDALTISTPVSVPGPSTAAAPLPAPSSTTNIVGYTVAINGTPVAGREAPPTISVSRDGQPVTDLQPYLDTYAHLTAIHQGDLAFAHLHPTAPDRARSLAAVRRTRLDYSTTDTASRYATTLPWPRPSSTTPPRWPPPRPSP